MEPCWPTIEDNTVQIIVTIPVPDSKLDSDSGPDSEPDSDSKSDVEPEAEPEPDSEPEPPPGDYIFNGIVIYANSGNMFVLTAGSKLFFSRNSTIYVRFCPDGGGEGVRTTKFTASILTDEDDSIKLLVAILYVSAPFKKNGPRFIDYNIETGLPIFICANIYNYRRFCRVSGYVSSPSFPGSTAGYKDIPSLMEYVIAVGNNMEGAGIYDLSGCLVGVHVYQKIATMEEDLSNETPDFSYGTPLSQGIPMVHVIPIIKKLCNNNGVQDGNVHKMLDGLSNILYGTQITIF